MIVNIKNLRLFSFLFFIILISCTNEKEIDELLNADINLNVEKGTNIKMIYSDSAVVKIILRAPKMERHLTAGDTKDVFPEGIEVDFVGADLKPHSWLEANYAVREENIGKTTAKGRVVFYNDKDQKLETPELIWDERQKIFYTDKIVRITESMKGDTTYGFGFEANQEFTRFEIKKKVQGKRNVSQFLQGFN